MKRILFIGFIIYALQLNAQVDYHKIAVTRWAGAGRPDTYPEYLARHPIETLRWFEVERRYAHLDQTGAFLIIVEESILSSLTPEIDRYLSDLVDAEWDPILLSMSGGTAEDLRGILQQYWESDSIKGSVLIGNLPQAWFELYEDFDNDGVPDNPWQVQFPCDMYYMDLDGQWYDGDLDGILDTHLFDWEPDIFIGQLIASPLGSQVSLLSNYFDKNHAFRTGNLYLPGLGLAYIDDDWSGSAYDWGAALAQASGLVEVVGGPDSTTAIDYLSRLNDDHYALLLAAHSNPLHHHFYENGGTVFGDVYYWQIQQADPDAFYYNLFCCSGCRYSSDNYIGGWYLFGDTYGQGVIGSTKTGSMLYFEDYYGQLEDGECVGEAFRRWMAMHGQEPGSIMWAMSWFYGMTHLGDPTLFMKVGVEIADVEIIDDGTAGSVGDADGIPDAGETIALTLTLQNNDQMNKEDVAVKLSTVNYFIGWLSDSIYLGTLPGNAALPVSGFRFTIDPAAPDNMDFVTSVQITDGSGGFWGDVFTLTIRASNLVLNGFEMIEISGNGDPFADPGESFDLILEIRNQGGDDSDPATTLLASLGTYVLPDSTVVNLSALAPGASGNTSTGVPVIIQSNCPADYAEVLRMTIEEQGGTPEDQFLLFPVGDQQNWIEPVSNPIETLVDYNVSEGFINQWHESTARNYSAPYSMKCGGLGPYNYAARADGALETPLFRLGQTGELRFQHWIAAETGYDGGILEINNGQGWQPITPVGGYPGISVNNGSFPGGPCYNGRLDWSEALFDLSGYTGFAKLRFRFGSDGGVQDEGWYVDDIQVAVVGSAGLPISVTLIPENPPIVIPAAGGSFNYNILGENSGPDMIIADIWCDVTLPNGSNFGPTLGPVLDFTFPGNWSSNRDRTQSVPPAAPVGIYSYQAYIGEYPDIIYDQDSFPFEKSGSAASGNGMEGWFNEGESFEDLLNPPEMRIPERCALFSARPNPFNPVTSIRYELPTASFVELTLYDISGREVQKLINAWRNAGTHEFSFNASHLPSGVFFLQFRNGGYSQIEKLVLIK